MGLVFSVFWLQSVGVYTRTMEDDPRATTEGLRAFRAAMRAGDADGASRALGGIPRYYNQFPITPLVRFKPEDMTPEWLASPIGLVCGANPPAAVHVYYFQDHELDRLIDFHKTDDFELALENDDLDGARRALIALADPNAVIVFEGRDPTTRFMMSPLTMCFGYGSATMVRGLIEDGLKIRHAVDFEQALESAWDVLPKVELLLKNGLDPNSCLLTGFPLMHMAIDRPDVVKMMLEYGGVATASALEATTDELETARLLIEYGAHVPTAVGNLKHKDANEEEYKLWEGPFRDVCLSTWFTWAPAMHWRTGRAERDAIRTALVLRHVTPEFGQLPNEIMFMLFEHLCTVVVREA